MQKLCESPSLVDLQLIANYLGREGVAIEILNKHQGGTPGVPHWAISVWAELWVRDPAQFELAAKLLTRYQQEQSLDSVSEWTCKGCKEQNPDNFETCWHCGSNKH